MICPKKQTPSESNKKVVNRTQSKGGKRQKKKNSMFGYETPSWSTTKAERKPEEDAEEEGTTKWR